MVWYLPNFSEQQASKKDTERKNLKQPNKSSKRKNKQRMKKIKMKKFKEVFLNVKPPNFYLFIFLKKLNLINSENLNEYI